MVHIRDPASNVAESDAQTTSYHRLTQPPSKVEHYIKSHEECSGFSYIFSLKPTIEMYLNRPLPQYLIFNCFGKLTFLKVSP